MGKAKKKKMGKNTRSRTLSAEGCLTDILTLACEHIAVSVNSCKGRISSERILASIYQLARQPNVA